MDTNFKKSDNKNQLGRCMALAKAPENYSSLPIFAKGEALTLFTESGPAPPESLAIFSSKAHMLIDIKRSCFLLSF